MLYFFWRFQKVFALLCIASRLKSSLIKPTKDSCYSIIQLILFLTSVGRKHDAGMLANSRLLDQLQRFAHSPLGNPFCLYGDPGYPLRIHLIQAPFRDRALTSLMMDFNKSMSTVRESVKWIFNDIATYFKFLDFKKNLKIGLSSVGKMYVVCALLRNAHAFTCLYGNQTSTFFELDPLSPRVLRLNSA